MIRIKRGSHAYVLLCFIGLVGELPYKSLHLLGLPVSANALRLLQYALLAARVYARSTRSRT